MFPFLPSFISRWTHDLGPSADCDPVPAAKVKKLLVGGNLPFVHRAGGGAGNEWGLKQDLACYLKDRVTLKAKRGCGNESFSQLVQVTSARGITYESQRRSNCSFDSLIMAASVVTSEAPQDS